MKLYWNLPTRRQGSFTLRVPSVTSLRRGLSSPRVSPQQLEAGRISLVRYLRSVYPDYLHRMLKVRVLRTRTVRVTRKGVGTRMGKGKGALQGYVWKPSSAKRNPVYQLTLPLLPTGQRDSFIHRAAQQRSKKLGLPLSYYRVLT